MPLNLLFKADPFFQVGSDQMKENCMVIERLLESLHPKNCELINMCNAYITNSTVAMEMRDDIIDELQNHNVFKEQGDLVISFMEKLKFIRRNIKNINKKGTSGLPLYSCTEIKP